MHKIADKEFTIEDFSCEYLGVTVPAELNDGEEVFQNLWIESLKRTIEDLNIARGFYIREQNADLKKKYWEQMIQLLPSSYNQTRNVMMNYEVLANIYKSRKGHKLNEWCELCAWIEELPYSELICGDGIQEGLSNIDDEIVNKVADKFCEIGNINPLSKEEINRIKEN